MSDAKDAFAVVGESDADTKLKHLKKGQSASIDISLDSVLVCLGWEIEDGGHEYSFDSFSFVLGEDDKVAHESDIVFYANMNSYGDAVVLLGDNSALESKCFEEIIRINFDKMPSEAAKIKIALSIWDAHARQQTFNRLCRMYVRIAKSHDELDTNRQTFILYDLKEQFIDETIVEMCEIYRSDGEWRFKATAKGYKGGITEVCKEYGLDVG